MASAKHLMGHTASRTRGGGERMRRLNHIEIGFQTYLVEGGEAFGAVRGYVPDLNALVVYVENAGDFVVPLEEVHSVHNGKVILDAGRIDERLQAIGHAHDREQPGA
jgi:hypothetical protein